MIRLILLLSSAAVSAQLNNGWRFTGRQQGVQTGGGTSALLQWQSRSASFPVQPKFYSTLPDGSKVCTCYDPQTGLHEHASSWVSPLRFKLRCNNGTTDVEACIGSRRGNYVEVPVNETKDVNGFEHKCEQLDGKIKYTQEPSCIVNGDELHINETFRQGNFKLNCETWGYSIAGCFFGPEGNDTELAVGETSDDANLRHFCEEVDGFKGRVRYRVQAVKCAHDDSLYEEGESWAGTHLKYLCKENGAITIINCLTSNGTEIAVGQAIVEDGNLHRCYRVGNTVYYQANGCGPNSAACNSGFLTLPGAAGPFRPVPRPIPNPLTAPEYPFRLNSNANTRTGLFSGRPFFKK